MLYLTTGSGPGDQRLGDAGEYRLGGRLPRFRGFLVCDFVEALLSALLVDGVSRNGSNGYQQQQQARGRDLWVLHVFPMYAYLELLFLFIKKKKKKTIETGKTHRVRLSVGCCFRDRLGYESDESGRSEGRFCNVADQESKSVAYCSCLNSMSQLKRGQYDDVA